MYNVNNSCWKKRISLQGNKYSGAAEPPAHGVTGYSVLGLILYREEKPELAKKETKTSRKQMYEYGVETAQPKAASEPKQAKQYTVQ